MKREYKCRMAHAKDEHTSRYYFQRIILPSSTLHSISGRADPPPHIQDPSDNHYGDGADIHGY
jgi:hypothetical protein